MRLRAVLLVPLAAGLMAVAAGVQAQGTPSGAAPAPAPTHRTRHAGPRIGHPAGSTMAFAGAIIGDRHTKVYHLPGDKGMLPKEKNRVYFKTEAEAQAAGYRRAGSRRVGAMRRTPVLPRDQKTGRFLKRPMGK